MNILFKENREIRNRISLLCLSLTLLYSVSAQIPDTLVMIGSSTSGNYLKLDSNGSFLLKGNLNLATSFEAPATGPGSRLVWIPEKAAFRAGYVDGTQWNLADIGNYSFAAGEGVRASADNAVALGRYSQATQVQAFAIGDQCTASGSASVAMGYRAHTNARQGSFVFSDRSSVDTLRAGVNHSANWRVSGGFRIFTSSNLSTGVTIQSGASVSNWGQSNAVISTSTGAYLSTGGIWTNVSDINRKHLFEMISGENYLKLLRNLSIQKWSYKTENESIRHIGPTAQDFKNVFGLGSDEKAIGTVDADGVALLCIQALEKRTREQTEEIDELKSRIHQLEQLIKNNRPNNPVLPVSK